MSVEGHGDRTCAESWLYSSTGSEHGPHTSPFSHVLANRSVFNLYSNHISPAVGKPASLYGCLTLYTRDFSALRCVWICLLHSVESELGLYTVGCVYPGLFLVPNLIHVPLYL